MNWMTKVGEWVIARRRQVRRRVVGRGGKVSVVK
jgi:hypothetical protein